MGSKHVFFPGLNSIRCLAVLLVIFQHLEAFKQKAGKFSLYNRGFVYGFISNIGHQGVVIFFTLSGFLITYLLLNEKQYSQTINIKKFYIRRILRIWPLYFIIVILGFFVFPAILDPSYFAAKTQPDFVIKLLLTVSFLPNAVFFIYGHIFSIGVLWSIGTEEQFYLIWPHLVKRIRSLSLLKNLVIILASVVVLKTVLWILMGLYKFDTMAYKIAFVAYHFLEYDAMIIGAIAAFIYFSRHQLLGLLYNRKVQIAVYAVACIMLFKFSDLGPVTNLVFAVFYAVLILNLATNPESVIKAGNPVFEFLGKISYGMYIYHSVCIVICISLLNKWGNMGVIPYNLALYTAAVALTIIVCTASYYLIEKPILNYKTKFMVIKSSN